MNNKITSIFTFNSGVATSIVATAEGKQYIADVSHPNWKAILEAIKQDDVTAFVNAIDIKKAFQNYMVGNVKIVGNEVWHGNTRLGGVVVDRIFDFMSNQLPVEPIMRFIDNLFQNPSSRAVNELYKFLEHKHLPITTEGNFRAYKGLKDDFYSVTAGNLTLLQGKANEQGYIYNGVGETVECIRHQVNDNKEEGCSYGLHAGSLDYAKGFSQGKLVEVEINPKDVVSIPTDCNCEKLRTCKYVVVKEFTAPLDSVYVNSGSFNNNPMPEQPDNDAGDDDALFNDDHCCGGDCGCDDNDEDNYDGDCCDCGDTDSDDCECDEGCQEAMDKTADEEASNQDVNRKDVEYSDGFMAGELDAEKGDGYNLHKYNHIRPSSEFHKGYTDGYNAEVDRQNKVLAKYNQGFALGKEEGLNKKFPDPSILNHGEDYTKGYWAGYNEARNG